MSGLSVVIPAWNEAAKIGADVRAAAAFLAGEGGGEVIVVDDGSSDGTARAAEEAFAAAAGTPAAAVALRVVRFDRNRGKGAAVKAGVLASSGEVVLVADSGSCVPYADARDAIARARAGTLDLGLGSRRHARTLVVRDRPLRRRLLSALFHALARAAGLLPRGVRDSQCGFKVYRGDAARRIFSGCETPGYLYELEVLRAARREGLRTEEFPIRWTCDPDTRLRPRRDWRGVWRELRRLRRS